MSRFILALMLTVMTMPSYAYVGSPTIRQLCDESELIVLATVTKIHPDGRDKMATARIIETWKGRFSSSEVRFRASGVWTCDASHAEVGETVVLFLDRGSFDGHDRRTPSAEWVIAYHGRGRLVITDTMGAAHVDAWGIQTDRSWPRLRVDRGIASLGGDPSTRYPIYDVYVPLTRIRQAVAKWIAR